MNYNEIVRPFTRAVAKTTGTPLPVKPMLLDVAARRFIYDNVMSEMGEYLTADGELDQIDALVDAIIYITDACIRSGIAPFSQEKVQYSRVGVVHDVYLLLSAVVTAITVDTQHQAISRLLDRLRSGHSFDLDPFVAVVANANMQKINSDGLVDMNSRGKVLKPEGFVAPDLSIVLKEVQDGR